MKHLVRALLGVCLVALPGAGVSCSSSRSGPGDAATSEAAQADAESDGGNAQASGSLDAASDLPMNWSTDASVDAAGVGTMLPWPGSAVGEVAVAATDDTLAIAYVEPSADTGSELRLMLQLLDGDLNARGAARALDRQPIGDNPNRPIPSVATDGTGFLVCWSPMDQVRCLAPGPSDGASLLFQTAGITPTVAFHGETWALAYVASPSRSQMNEARAVRISREGEPLGEPAGFPYDAYFSRPVPFVSTASGFALLAGQPKLSLYRLAADLSVQGTPFDTGLSSWSYRTLAATDDEAAMGLARPYGNVLVHVRGSEVLRQERECGEKGGCDVAVALQGNTFAVAWWSGSGQVSVFGDIDGAGTSQDGLAGVVSSIVLVSFRSRLIVVSKGAP